MDEEEKRFKVEKVLKYQQLEKNSNAWKETKAVERGWFIIGVSGLALLSVGGKGIYDFYKLSSSVLSLGESIPGLQLGISGIGTILSASGIKGFLKSMKEKTNLEEKIDIINAELDQVALEKTRGGR